MAGNYGKYVDRSPVICAAGKVSGDPKDNVESALKQYGLVDEINALKHDANIWKSDQFIPPRKLPPIQGAQFLGTNTQVSKLLNPPVLTRYQHMIGDLKDTVYSSYWNAEIGKVRDPVPGLPAGMNPLEVTFGNPSKKDISLKEVVNPSKSHYEVLRDCQVGHELYKKTHNDYNPSEKVQRGYNKPPFNPNKCYGQKTKYDPRGIWVKCACDWYQKEPLVHANKLQADFFKRTRPRLGQVLAPNNNISLVPKNHTFGDASNQDFYGVEDLLKDPNVQPCVFKRDVRQWIASLNKTRMAIKQKRIHGFDIEDFYKKALYLDKAKSGFLPFEDLRKLFSCSYIMLPTELECLCYYLNYIVDGKTDYRKFIDLIDNNKELIDMRPIEDVPKESKYYISTSRAAGCDYLDVNNTDSNRNMPTAGIPSIRHDLPRPVAPSGGIRAAIENFGDETSAKSVVNPSIYTNFGLTYRDFFLPRSSQVIRNLFEKLGYNFIEGNFEKLWEMGVKEDQTGQVCIDTFKRLLQSKCQPLRLRVDEKQI
ncbi:EF-hand domain-containing family member B isoform X2 [Dendroctonus ponderosae]|uniref:EF-hand domain-containing family member B isoform X2 n=1 Tax=Dendroctonus ponderosae TaxID=77166 RepID=UPI002034D0CA|nr:EF-hand domain-containing family member B isoform X2 [Dendroctonus ponderosae]